MANYTVDFALYHTILYHAIDIVIEVVGEEQRCTESRIRSLLIQSSTIGWTRM